MAARDPQICLHPTCTKVDCTIVHDPAEGILKGFKRLDDPEEVDRRIEELERRVCELEKERVVRAVGKPLSPKEPGTDYKDAWHAR